MNDLYYSRNGGTLNGSITLNTDTSKIIFRDGSSQSSAFTNGMKNQLDYMIN